MPKSLDHIHRRATHGIVVILITLACLFVGTVVVVSLTLTAEPQPVYLGTSGGEQL